MMKVNICFHETGRFYSIIDATVQEDLQSVALSHFRHHDDVICFCFFLIVEKPY